MRTSGLDKIHLIFCHKKSFAGAMGKDFVCLYFALSFKFQQTIEALVSTRRYSDTHTDLRRHHSKHTLQQSTISHFSVKGWIGWLCMLSFGVCTARKQNDNFIDSLSCSPEPYEVSWIGYYLQSTESLGNRQKLFGPSWSEVHKHCITLNGEGVNFEEFRVLSTMKSPCGCTRKPESSPPTKGRTLIF